MLKKLLCFLLFLTLFSDYCFAQNIPVITVTRAGRFITCGTLTPNITVTRVGGGPGSSVVGGALICSDPCDTTILNINLGNLEWDKNPGNNWIHSVYFPANAGVTFLSTTLSPSNWGYFAVGCTGTCPSGIVGSRGYYFNGPGQICCPGGGQTTPNPCDNYGDIFFNCGVPLNFI